MPNRSLCHGSSIGLKAFVVRLHVVGFRVDKIRMEFCSLGMLRTQDRLQDRDRLVFELMNGLLSSLSHVLPLVSQLIGLCQECTRVNRIRIILLILLLGGPR